jgi:flavin-dependent dehydrogenase
LISDALRALETLDLFDRVAADVVEASELWVYVPSGLHVPLKGRFACVPRERLDAVLLEGAIEAGAQFISGLTALGAIEADGQVRGARFRAADDEVTIAAPIVLLATGANATALTAFGFDVPKKPSAVAGRAYFQAPPEIAARFRHLTIAYDRDWCPGYGWIFPSPGNRFNIGVGLFPSTRETRPLRHFWDAFRTQFPPAAAIIAASTQLTEFRGAPLRTGLTCTQFGRPGLLAIGEAASLTYPATGEGIGKAMESALLAANLIVGSDVSQSAAESLHVAYGAEFRRRFSPRYRAYQVAQAWAAHAVVINLLAARASRGRFARAELEALIAETGDARVLFSVKGLVSALLR